MTATGIADTCRHPGCGGEIDEGYCGQCGRAATAAPPISGPPGSGRTRAGMLAAGDERLVHTRLFAAPRYRTAASLAALAAAATVALVLLSGALALSTGAAASALRVVGHDAGPQVVATTDLYYALSDADAQVANVLLVGDEHEARRTAALARYEQRRAEIGTALLEAHRLAGTDPAQRRTIASILEGFGRYERLAARTLLLSEQAAHPAGVPPEPVLASYREATDLMSLELLPQAYNLTLENGTTVRRTHDGARGTITGWLAAALAAGLLMLGFLGWLQLRLARRFRRVFNPALLVATTLALLYAVAGVTLLATGSGALQEAKREGFDSLLSLARARAVSNGLHADQVRYLIDPQRADTYDQIYLDKAQSLVYVEAGNLAEYHDGVAALADARPAAVPGLLGSQVGASPELGGRAAVAALAAYDELQRADQRLRALAGGGRTGEAVALRLGPLAAAFDAYDAALVELTDRHRAAFEREIAGGEKAMASMSLLQPVATVSIAVLIAAGVWPRIREYR